MNNEKIFANYIYMNVRLIDYVNLPNMWTKKRTAMGESFLHVCLAFAFMTWAFVVPTHAWAYTNSDTHMCIILCSYDLLLFWFSIKISVDFDMYTQKESEEKSKWNSYKK